MYAPNDSALPPHTGMRRLIAPWEYRSARRLRAFARVRFAASFFLAGLGLCALALSYGWTPLAEHRTVIYVVAAALLASAAGNFAFARWLMTIAGS